MSALENTVTGDLKDFFASLKAAIGTGTPLVDVFSLPMGEEGVVEQLADVARVMQNSVRENAASFAALKVSFLNSSCKDQAVMSIQVAMQLPDVQSQVQQLNVLLEHLKVVDAARFGALKPIVSTF